MIDINNSETYFNEYQLLPEIIINYDKVNKIIKKEKLENFFTTNNVGNIANQIMYDNELLELNDFPLFIKKYLDPSFMGHKISNVSKVKNKIIRNSIGRRIEDIFSMLKPLIRKIVDKEIIDVNDNDKLNKLGEISNDLFLSYFIRELFNFYFGAISQKKILIAKYIESDYNDNISFNIGLDNDKIDMLIHLNKPIKFANDYYYYEALQVKPLTFLNHFDLNSESHSCGRIGIEYNARKCYSFYDSDIFTKLNRFVFYYYKKDSRTTIDTVLFLNEIDKLKNSQIELIKKELIYNDSTENYEIIDFIEENQIVPKTQENVDNEDDTICKEDNKGKVRNNNFIKFNDFINRIKKNTKHKIEKTNGRILKINGEKGIATFPLNMKWDKIYNNGYIPTIPLFDTNRKKETGFLFNNDYTWIGILQENEPETFIVYDKNEIYNLIDTSILTNLYNDIIEYSKNTCTEEENKNFVNSMNEKYFKNYDDICLEIHDSGDNGKRYFFSISIKKDIINSFKSKYIFNS